MLRSAAWTVLGALCLIGPVSSPASETGSIFGFELQKPLSLPQCRHETQNGQAFYVPPSAGACYELTFGDGPGMVDDASRIVDHAPTNGPVVIVWEVADKPAIVAGRGALATLSDGKLQGIIFKTRGVLSQDEVYQTLVGQFGAATATERSPLQGEAGTTALPMFAKWHLDAVDVLFDSAADGFDKGIVSISARESGAPLFSNAQRSEDGRVRS